MLQYPSKEILVSYKRLVEELDTAMAELCSVRFENLKCGPGCSSCCVRFSVLPLEAAIVQANLARSGKDSDDQEKCALLVDDRCTVYKVRPLICRSQGLPIAYIDEAAGALEVSACPLNFPDDYPLVHEDLLYMDRFNVQLAELNRQYCEEAGLNPEQRIALEDLQGIGNELFKVK